MDSFEKLYYEYYDIVFKYIFSLCKDELWAEEITQESFFKALKNIESFRGESKLSTWLCQIAKNTFYTDLKKRQKEDNIQIEKLPYYDTVEEKILKNDENFEIHKILHNLLEPYKEVFWMRTFGELSFKEIADIFNKTESWARVTYHRAKMKIKEELK